MKTFVQILIDIFLFFLLGNLLTAANSEPQASKLQVKAVRAEAITVDGKLSEPAWKDHLAVAQFTQRDPVEGAQPSEKTIVDVLYDDDAIYIGARMYDSSPKGIIALLGRKDVDLTADQFTVYIDPYHDRRTGYYFSVNAAGTQYDGTLYNDSWSDSSWDGVWEGIAKVDEQGWTIEMRIPYSQLRFRKSDRYVWGINFKRIIARKNENVYLVYQPKNGNGFVSRFPDLVGIENITPRRRLEVIPYVTGKASYTNPDSGDPFHDGTSYDPGAGADLKLGLGSNLTLSATANPDFGQVEVDPAVVNLSDVETFFDEKRPFFIEGSSIFDFGQGGANSYWGFNWSNPLFFYSRRIGRAPQGTLPDSDFQDAPAGTKILAASKLTGKLGTGWNVGTLHAFTGREFADISLDDQQSKVEIEPLTYYQVSRAQREFSEGRQGLGFITTYSSRFFEDEDLRTDVNSNSLVFGVDGWTFLDANKTWVVSGYTGLSHIKGSASRITDVQENSQHYFQRPDADYVEVDPDATSLTGYVGRVYLNKEKGNVYMNSAFGFVSPKFDNNDLGFLWRADQINTHTAIGYKWTTPGKFFRYAEAAVAAFRSWDYDWGTVWSGLFQNGYIEFSNYYTLDYSIAWNPEKTLNNTRTRGGPQTLNLHGFETNLFVRTDKRKQWVFGGGENTYESGNSSTRSVNAEVEWKPVANVSLKFAPQFERFSTPAFWINNYEDPFATHTFQHRYVFGELHQDTFSASFRVNWTFTPKLSLQFYGQPLISAGDYSHFKELAAAKTYDFNIYPQQFISLSDGVYTIDPDGAGPANAFSFDNPDFNFKSLRGNAVLRWEYRPGATVFFVWTQTRSDNETLGEFRFDRSLSRLWKADADNIFLVKFTYYWNM